MELFNKNQLHSFLNSTEFAYAVVSQQGRLFSFNNRFIEIFGIPNKSNWASIYEFLEPD